MSDNDSMEVPRKPVSGGGPSPFQRKLQLALDITLILLVILIASGQRLTVRAGIDQSTPPDARLTAASGVGEVAVPMVNQPAPALLDNQTLAAMIAAENAALTPPLYFSSLPLIVH